MAATNEQQAQITGNGKERGALGAAGAARSRSVCRQTAQPRHHRATGKGAGVSELISGCWKEKQSDRKANLHMGSDPALAAVGTKIPIYLCGLPVRAEECEDSRGGEEPRNRVLTPCRDTGVPCNWSCPKTYVEQLFKIVYASCPCHVPWSVRGFIPRAEKSCPAPLAPASADVHASLPSWCHQLREPRIISPLFSP